MQLFVIQWGSVRAKLDTKESRIEVNAGKAILFEFLHVWPFKRMLQIALVVGILGLGGVCVLNPRKSDEFDPTHFRDGNELEVAAEKAFPLGSDFIKAKKFFLGRKFDYRVSGSESDRLGEVHRFLYRKGEWNPIPGPGFDCQWIVGFRQRDGVITNVGAGYGCYGL